MLRCNIRRLREFLSAGMLLAAFIFPWNQAVADDIYGKVTSPDGYQGLMAKVQKSGTVKVIVKLKTSFTPESLVSKAEADAQRASISRAQNRLVSALETTGHKPTSYRSFKYIPHIAMTIDREALDALLTSSEVENVEEDIPVPPVLDLSVPRIGATSLHSKDITGNGIAVAVLDTGVDKNHPFLKGSVVSEACYSTIGSSYNSSSVCPGGVTSSLKTGSALPYAGSCPSGACDHGTHVSGIIAGRDGVSGSPGPGVAPKASIIAIQVFSNLSNYCGYPCVMSFTSDQISGLERVYELKDKYKIASVNMSLGAGGYATNCDSDSRKSIIDTLKSSGIATVIASGNSGYCGYVSAPACISSAISVGATDDLDVVADYSNSASLVSVLAPGSSINSSIPLHSGGGYESWNGTSMATPHVAGAWALMKQSLPSATVDEILTTFTSTGISVTDTGKCASVTRKRINVNDAYSSIVSLLTVNLDGISKGTVAADGLSCSGTTCSGTYNKNTAGNITLTPTPAYGAFFNGWTGCDSESGNNCIVAMSSDKMVTAVFTPPPKITVSPMSINFGYQKAEVASAPKSVTIKNNAATGGADLVLESTSITGTDKDYFILNNLCPASLTKGEHCTATLTTTSSPTTFGAKSAVLQISTNDPKTPTTSVKLTAVVAPPIISATPAAISFGAVKTGAETGTKVLTIKNTGLSDLKVNSLTLGGDTSFAVKTNTCGGSVAKGGSCSVTLTVSPATFGAKTGALTISSNDPKKADLMVKLMGTASPPIIIATPASVSFGSVAMGASVPKTVTIKNTGLSDLGISSINLGGTDSSQFGMIHSCNQIPKGTSCPISVNFSPSSFGAKMATLTISSNDPNKANLTVKLTGTTAFPPIMTVTPTSVSFGSVATGTSVPKTVTIKNTGLSDLSISSINLGGTDSSQFGMIHSCNQIPKGTSCSINLTFSPTSTGAKNATLTIISNAPQNGNVAVKISGTGK